MRTVEVVKTWRGWHVTRKYCGRTVESHFFSTIVPPKITDSKKIREFQEGVEKDKDKYVAKWVA